jgi:hypothetical protein
MLQMDLSLFKTPGTRRAPMTPTRGREGAPRTPKGLQSVPRTAATQELMSSDGHDNVKVLNLHGGPTTICEELLWHGESMC